MAALFVALALCLVPAMASATLIVTTPGAFLAQVQPGYYLEDFDFGGYVGGISSPYASPTVNGFSFEATAPGGLWALPSQVSGNGALSTTASADLFRITFTGAPVTAVAGTFYSTDLPGNLILQNITIALNDGSSQTFVGSGFVGFVSNVPIAYLEANGVDSPGQNWPAVDDLYVGASVPEPGTLLLLGSGIAALALRRRGKA